MSSATCKIKNLVNNYKCSWRKTGSYTALYHYNISLARFRNALHYNKLKFSSNTVHKCHKNPRLLWKKLNNLSYWKKHSSQVINNTLFNQIVQYYKSKFISPNTPPINCDFFSTGKFDFKRSDLINSLLHRNKYTKGHDGIPFIYYQKVIPHVCNHFLYLFKLTLENCFCPIQWSHSYLIPALKPSKDPKLPSSYRPINISYTMLKIFKKMLLGYIDFNVKNSISPSQHYASKFHSTTSNLIEFTSLIFTNFEHKTDTYTAFLDLTAAFDSIDLSILYHTLKMSFNLDIILANWIVFFLSNCKYTIKHNDTLSDSFSPNGVQQGSSLSALLFILYLNPIFSLTTSKIIGYADDIKVIHSDINILCSDLSLLQTWLKDCNLKLNIDKTVFMKFSIKPNTDLSETVYFNNSCFPLRYTHLDLGIYLDSRLTFSTHINHICAIIYKKTGFMWRYFRKLRFKSIQNLGSLYYSLSSTLLSFCIQFCLLFTT